MTTLTAAEAASVPLIYEWLGETFETDSENFGLALLLIPRSPWLTIKAKPLEVFVVNELPERVDLAVWRHTGDVYRVIDGMVEGDPIIRLQA